MAPSKLPTACARRDCPELTLDRYCPAHKREYDRQYEQGRPSAIRRGYGRQWQRYRKWFLSDPVNAMCATGCGLPSTDVDHIQPVAGPDDPLFWEPSNHQALCHGCHSRKTVRDGRWTAMVRG